MNPSPLTPVKRVPRNVRPLIAKLVVRLLLAVAAIGGCRALGSHLSLNVTSSLPRGLYWLRPSGTPRVGSTVAFLPPDSVRDLVTARRYLPPGIHLLKRVVALEGDRVCIDHSWYSVNGEPIDVIASADSRGQRLHPFAYCGSVATGVAFVAGHGPTSLDSRYFGPVPLATLTLAVPLWTFF